MRIFEKILLVLPVLWVGMVLLGDVNWLVHLGWLFLFALGVWGAHFVLDKYRWQMIPAYLVWAYGLVLVFLGEQGKTAVLSPLEISFILGGVLVSVGLIVLFPIPRWPVPTGPYAVGTTALHLRDTSRIDPYAQTCDEARELMVQFWYPAHLSAADLPPTLHPHFGVDSRVTTFAVAKLCSFYLKTPFFPKFLFSHLRLLRTTAVPEAAIIQQKHPVLFFVHGAGGARAQNLSLMEELASHGYVVASADHTYGSLYVQFPERVAYFSDKVFPKGVDQAQAGKQLVQVWCEDAQFMLNELHRLNQVGDWSLAGCLNLNQVGILGHSTGGATAVGCCQQDDRFQLGIGLDAWLEALPTHEPVPTQPILLTQTPRWLGEANSDLGWRLFSRLPRGCGLTLDQTTHQNFSDIPLFLSRPVGRLSGMVGKQDIYVSIDTLRRCLLGYLAVYLPSQANERSGRVFVDVGIAFQTTMAHSPYSVEPTPQVTGVPIYENA